MSRRSISCLSFTTLSIILVLSVLLSLPASAQAEDDLLVPLDSLEQAEEQSAKAVKYRNGRVTGISQNVVTAEFPGFGRRLSLPLLVDEQTVILYGKKAASIKQIRVGTIVSVQGAQRGTDEVFAEQITIGWQAAKAAVKKSSFVKSAFAQPATAKQPVKASAKKK